MTTIKRTGNVMTDASLRDAENKLTAAESRVTALEEADIDLTTDVTGTLPVANGGTGATTLTGIVVGNGTSPFTAGAIVTRAQGGWGAAVLTGSATWNPGDILAGAYEETTVTVTGVAQGDLVLASFDQLAGEHFEVEGNVSGSNAVYVRLHNHDTSTRNLSSGTVRVWVVPKF